MSEILGSCFRIGEWRVDPSLNRLRYGRLEVKVTPKAMQVLLCLASHQGQVLSRTELLEMVWPDAAVGEEVLTRAISDLRKVFREGSRDQVYIQTIPKKGYRLIATVSVAEAPSVSSAPGETPRGKAAFRSSVWKWLAMLLLVACSALLLIERFLDKAGTEVRPLPVTPLTSLPGSERDPSYAPDGRRVAFAYRPAGKHRSHIWVTARGEFEARRLTDGEGDDRSPAWSPDGSQIAFMRRYREGCTIEVVAATGGDLKRLGSCGRNVNPDLVWSPTGSWLAFSDRDSTSEPYGIYLYSPASGRRRRLTFPAAQHWGDKDPAFSPDGKRLSFVRSVSMGVQDLFISSLDGKRVRRLTFDSRSVFGQAWFPGGRSLLVSSMKTGTTSLWRILLDDSKADWLPVKATEPRQPDLSPDGKRVTFEDWSGDLNLHVLDLNSGRESPLDVVSSTRTEKDPQFAPASSHRLAFISSRTGSAEVWVSDAGKLRRLTSFGATITSSPRWSPDGRWVAFDSRPYGQSDIYVVDQRGGAIRRLTRSKANDLLPSWSMDGRWIYFGSDRTGKWQIWKVPVDGGRPVQVTRTGGYRALQSEVDEALYCTRYDQPGIWRLSGEGGEEVQLPGTGGLLDATLWDVKGGRIYLLSRSTGQASLVIITLESGATRHLKLASSPLFGTGLSVRSGLILFTRRDRSQSDLQEIRLP